MRGRAVPPHPRIYRVPPRATIAKLNKNLFNRPGKTRIRSVRGILALLSVRKHPFLLALRRWGRFARRNDLPPRETSPAAKSEEKRILSQAKLCFVIL